VRWYTFWSINGFGTLRDTETHTWRINDTAHAEWNGKARTTVQVLMRMLDSCGRYEWPCCLTAWWWRCDAVTWRRVWQWHNGQNVANSVVLAFHWKVDNYESAEKVPCFCETQKLDYPLHSVPVLHPNVKLWNSVRYSHTLLLLTSVLILSSQPRFGLPGGLSLICFSTKIQSSILLCTCTAQSIFLNSIALITLNWGRAQVLTLEVM
jgi:hypothetical protein